MHYPPRGSTPLPWMPHGPSVKKKKRKLKRIEKNRIRILSNSAVKFSTDNSCYLEALFQRLGVFS